MTGLILKLSALCLLADTGFALLSVHSNQQNSIGTSLSPRSSRLYNIKKSEYWANDSEDEEDEGLITKEMFMREMLNDPKVKRKKKGKDHYKPLDNRDALPFVVKVVTPDPYTPVSKKKEEAIKNTRRDREQNKKTKKGGKKNLVGMEKSGIASSLYTKGKDGALEKILGEFQLDKSTNCGDVILVGDQEFEVQKARCQYKYAGGKRFVMVRKILEVKDVTRVQDEEHLLRQLQNSSNDLSPPQLE